MRESSQEGHALPDVLWKVFGDPSNAWIFGVMLVGLVGTVAGPWAILKAVSRSSKANPEE
jgi:hypothetical protein